MKQGIAPYLEMMRLSNIPAAYLFVLGGAFIGSAGDFNVFRDFQVRARGHSPKSNDTIKP